MKKITDFIIDKRHIILILFIILSIVSAILSNKVNINYDIAKYLPSTSETRIGMDIMESEFKEIESSSLNLMFEDLNGEEKIKIYEELEQIKGVDSVNYDNSEDYNKENYTLYVINIENTADSELAENVFNEIIDKYEDYTIYTSGEIADRYTDVLPFVIVVLAVVCALIILIVMCESYAEPFLFMTSILIAVLLNTGTNIMFESVSNITNSICAILQMALSMDYSIMLMNRYEQERQKENDKVKAMKKALHNAFSSISSSSVTTIVGLLALVFMSFTIGRDLGFVLAKGVLFSLISIFFVLPGLILIFDKLILKTKKKSPKFKMDVLGKFAYKIRYVAPILFIVTFIGCYLIKGNLGIAYTQTATDDIAKVFNINNQIALIYNTNDEEKVAEYLEKIENEENVDEVLGYGNTINESLTYDMLNQKFEDLGEDTKVDEYLLKIIYYNYYNQDENNTISFNEFVKFVKEDVYNNPNVVDKIDETTRKNIDRLSNFTNSTSINKKRTVAEIASILEISQEDVKDILIYYNSKNNNIKISLNEFIKFMNKDVLTNTKYADKINDNAKKSLETLSKFIDINTIKKEMTSKEMAKLFEISETSMNDLYTYYISINEIDMKLTISEFTNFVITDILTNPNYASNFDETTINNIKMLATFSNTDVITKNMHSQELADFFGMDKTVIDQLLFMKYINTDNVNTETWQMTPNELVTMILENESIKNTLDKQTVENLQLLSNVMTSTINKTNYSYKELSALIGIDETTLKSIYTLYISKNTNTKLTPQEFVDFVLEHKNDTTLSNNLDVNTINDLSLLQTVMNDVINNKKYSNQELGNLLGINISDINLLYGLYSSTYINANQTISLKDLITFILDDVITNSEYSGNFDDEAKSQLNTINGIMNASLNNIQYTKNEIFIILNKLADNLDKDQIDLLYMYYGSSNEYNNKWQMTVEQFVNYLNDDILQDNRFDDFIEEDMRQDIIDAKDTIDESRELLIGNNYSRVVINTKFNEESEETFNFIQKVKDELGSKLDDFYIIGNSPMAYEMSQTFQEELDFITILTMILIFVVVTITFKSISIPLILVFIIQCAVYMTMGILSFTGENVYFIALLIVQSILMGATIDYAIVYTTYYIEYRKTMSIKDSIINAYNNSIHTILTSASILIIVTLIIGCFTNAIASMICKTISQGTLCSAILILILLPAVLAGCDKIIIKKKE